MPLKASTGSIRRPSSKGMTQNSKGYWTTGETFENASESFHR
nr:MAG TPA: hypothetical protein [Caudoviricetes sp.]